MKKATLILLCLAFLPAITFGQLKKKLKSKGIYISTSLNYYPKVFAYDRDSEYEIARRQIDLFYTTPDSGVFEAEEEVLQVERSQDVEIPSQLLGIGASIQIMNSKRLFHEMSLTKFSLSKSSDETVWVYTDTAGVSRTNVRGYKQYSGVFAMRYEFGKYFGNRKNAKVRFGLSGAIEPAYYRFKVTPSTSQQFPLSANLLSIDLALIPMLNFRLAKKVSLDFKIIPNFLVGDFGGLRIENPVLPSIAQPIKRYYDLPEMNLAFSVLLRYEIQKARQKRRK